jgi:hypothetical protein
MFGRVLCLLSCLVLTACQLSVHYRTSLDHPSTTDSIRRAEVGSTDFSVKLVELTNETVCVEFQDRRMYLDNEADEERLRAARVELVVPGQPPRPTEQTAAAASKGAQFCADNDFIGPDTPELQVNVHYERFDLYSTFTFRGGKPRTGSWGGRGRTSFPTAEEARQRAEAENRAESQSRARLSGIIQQLQKAGYRCSKMPERGMLKVACDVGDGDVEVWSTDQAGSGFELISKWEARSSSKSFCDRHKRELDSLERSLDLSGDVRCVVGIVRYVDTIPYSENERWVQLLRRHVTDGNRVSRELYDRGHIH